MDGSSVLTPIGQFSTTTDTGDIAEAERVSVLIKNHTATITGNASSPSARIGTVNVLSGEVAGMKGSFDELSARVANFDQVYVQKGEFEELVVDKLDVRYAKIENLEVINQTVVNMQTEVGEFKELTTKNFSAVNADIENLTVEKLDVEEADIKYANIDFANIDFANVDKAKFGELFAQSGIIENYVSKDGVVTGKLVAVSINADNIDAGTLKAERLMLQGDDGLFYKLNVDAMGKTIVEQLSNDEQEALKSGIHGKSIIAESITADKISVSDLVAFAATIGGFKITAKSIYSGVKESVDNGTRGIYQDSDGQFAVGDGSNYIKYYLDSDGYYKLAISAESILLGSSDMSEVQNTADKALSTADAAEDATQTLLRNIQMLVTDANGQSLMTQTSDGWTFSTREIQERVDGVSDSFADLVEQLGSSEAAINRLSDSVDEFGKIAQYVYIGEYTYTDDRGIVQTEPSIDLFETDTGFKLKITNTRIVFTDGATKLFEIDSKKGSMIAPKVTVEKELVIGNPTYKNYVHRGTFDEEEQLYILDLPVGSYCIFSDILDSESRFLIREEPESEDEEATWGLVGYIVPNAMVFEVTKDPVTNKTSVFAIDAFGVDVDENATAEEYNKAITEFIIANIHIEEGKIPSTPHK